MKERICFFSIAGDDKNMSYYRMMRNSLKKFHPDIPLYLWDAPKIAKYNDPHFFYRATPIIARELIEKYDLVIQTNADQIITGSLDYVLNSDYEVGTVYNYNRVDTKRYGHISVFDIAALLYYNNGFIAMRSKKFVDHWYRLCHSAHFYNLQYREQDILNLILHYGDYKVRCFDDYDFRKKYSAWHGLRSKGEWHKAVMRGEDIVIPASSDGYPERDRTLKILHWAGGGAEEKMNYRIYFQPDVVKRLDYLVSDQNGEKTQDNNKQ